MLRYEKINDTVYFQPVPVFATLVNKIPGAKGIVVAKEFKVEGVEWWKD